MDANKRWRDIEIVTCGDISMLKKLVDRYDLTALSMLAVPVDTNDIDKKGGAEVFSILKRLIQV